MNLTESEKYVLALISAGMLQAGAEDGLISYQQLEIEINRVCNNLGTTMAILGNSQDLDPFAVIRNMNTQKKDFTKSFFYSVLQKVPTCEKATYYFVSTLEQSGLISVSL